MVSIIILGVVIFIIIVVAGLVWAVRQDEKDDKQNGQKNQ